jgi:hypothetical protein
LGGDQGGEDGTDQWDTCVAAAGLQQWKLVFFGFGQQG